MEQIILYIIVGLVCLIIGIRIGLKLILDDLFEKGRINPTENIFYNSFEHVLYLIFSKTKDDDQEDF